MSGGGLRHVAAGPDGRFLLLVEDRVPNLASRMPALPARRLPGNMRERFGRPALLAEAFAGQSLFRGTCCLAAGWAEAGTTRSFARSRNGWLRHGRPKTVPPQPSAAAAQALAGLDEPASWGLKPATPSKPPEARRQRSLSGHLRQVPEFRSAHGRRHSPAGVPAIAAAARLAGAQRGPPPPPSSAPARRSARLPQPLDRAPHAAPRAGMHRILSGVDPDALDRAVRKSAADRHSPKGALAIDGESAPLNRPGGADDARMLPAAAARGSGVASGQVASDSAAGEIPGARRLIRKLDAAGRVPALDALHGCPGTARLIIDEGAGCVLPVKGSRRSLLKDLKAFDPRFDAAPCARPLDKEHGRIEERICAPVPLDGRPDSLAPLHGRRQAFRIMRRRIIIA